MKNPPGRDLDLEHELLTTAGELTRQSTGTMSSVYERVVTNRLNIGAKRYGDTEFLRRDNIKELLEETPDIASYALLEFERLITNGLIKTQEEYAEMRMAAIAVIAAGNAADVAARRFGQLRKEMLGQ